MGLSVKEKVSEYRKRMRAAGLRPVQIWVPDTRSADFSQELARQVNLLRGKPEEKEALDFIEAADSSASWE